jgi:C-terminal processing protease CtpA/Prc
LPTLAVANVDVVSLYLLGKMHRQHLMQDVPLKGLVVDLRRTSGSSLLALNVILGELTTGSAGRFESRGPGGNVDLDVPLGPLYDKYGNLPLVLLVDSRTQGDAEIMAAVLQAQGRAKVVGTRTAGNTVSNETYTFGDESTLTIAQWRFFLSDGSNIDGRGVTPDVEVSADWTAQVGESDPYVEAAVSLLHSMDNP